MSAPLKAASDRAPSPASAHGMQAGEHPRAHTAKRTVQDIIAALSAGDRRPLEAHLAETVSLTMIGRSSKACSFAGDDRWKVAEYIYAQLFARGTFTPTQCVAEGDFVVVEAQGRMITRTGIWQDNRHCLVLRFAGGQIVDIREY